MKHGQIGYQNGHKVDFSKKLGLMIWSILSSLAFFTTIVLVKKHIWLYAAIGSAISLIYIVSTIIHWRKCTNGKYHY